MRLIDISTVITVALAVAVFLWWKTFSPGVMDLLAGIIPVLIAIWAIYNTVMNCKRILKKIRKSEKE